MRITQEQLEAAKVDLARKREQLGYYTDEHKLSFVRMPGGTVTVAYTVKHRVVTLATALRNPSDRDCRITGKYTAAKRYAAGIRIQFRLPRSNPFTYDVNVRDFIRAFLGN